MGGIREPPPREVLIDLSVNSVADDINNLPSECMDRVNEVSIDNGTIYTRHTNPFKPDRVAKILAEIKIGTDVTPAQHHETLDLIKEFADCFALAISEVNTVPGAVHKLDIPEDATFRTKIGQRSLNPPQKAYIHGKVKEMLAAGIIEPIHPRDVRAVAPTVLAKKTHDGLGLPMDELKHLLNDQCVEHGMPSIPDLPPRPAPVDTDDTASGTKWRICQDFGEINKVTQIAPMPQGDIRAKQQRLSGHRYIHVFDFAAGFYAIAIDPDSQPYIVFYVEGWGYFKYLRLPFGVTGGPSEFAQLTGQRLHDLTADGIIELFVDDGGSASDTFEEGIWKLRKLLERVRQEKLSLSPSKLRLFMTEAVFAGATVGPNGVSPDMSKLTAIVNWSQPQDVSHLEGFLGLAGYFRDLVKGYSTLEKPLRDILRAVDVPKGVGKQTYQRIMRNYKIGDIWKEEHTKAFLALKAKLISEPVLHAPRFDGTPFILTTDGSKDAFAGILTQKVTTTLPGGKEVTKRHPLGYASKRTSVSEEKYKPFLLEFAALKFSFDKFADILWGFPVEIETDCQALRDVLLSDNLNATHARWRDGVLAHNIVGVRHIPGVINIADGLSRQYEGTPKSHNDGSEWSVSPDSHKTAELANDVFQVEISDQQTALRNRFHDEPVFTQVIDALLELDQGTRIRERMRARHRALNYAIIDGKLWFIGGGTGVRARPKRECVTKAEAVELARQEHAANGHFHRDSIKMSLLDRIHSPKLDESIAKAIMTCARCKGFGGAHLLSLLNPITRRHPFELLVGDYLSLPEGKGGFQTVGLYLDTASQHVWGHRFKTKGSAKTTVKSLTDIFHNFVPPETFMSDGGTHFTGHEVKDYCSKWGTKTHVVAAYSPWVNGLVEGTNKLLIYILARLCAPDLGEDGWQETTPERLPRNWPDHFEEAIRILNWRILPALKFSPKELLLGMVVNTPNTPLELSTTFLPPTDIDTHMAYVAQQRLDGYSEAVHHAIRRKARFDRKVLKSKAGEVVFHRGQLVQVYRSDLENTLSTDKKLAIRWSHPRRVVERLSNSYRLETLDGALLDGEFSARRLREFTPRNGTELAEQQKEFMTKVQEKEAERLKQEAEMVEKLRRSNDAGQQTQTDDADNHNGGTMGLETMDEEQGFFYEEEEAPEEQEEGESIADRVTRRRGRRHLGEGQME